MSLLTEEELDDLRQKAADLQTARWSKSELNTVLDALDDWLEGEKSTISGVIDAASGGVSFTLAEKKWIFAIYMGTKFRKELN